MTFPTFEDWTPPWKSDDEFDAEKAKKLIYNLSKDKDGQKDRIAGLLADKDELQSKVTEFEEKDLSETERVKRENARLKAERENGGAGGGDDLERIRLEIALDKGLTKAQVKRLVGKTREELEADADAYMEEHGLVAAGDDDGDDSDGGTGGQAPPRQRVAVKRGGGKPSDDEDDLPDDPQKLLELAFPRR